MPPGVTGTIQAGAGAIPTLGAEKEAVKMVQRKIHANQQVLERVEDGFKGVY